MANYISVTQWSPPKGANHIKCILYNDFSIKHPSSTLCPLQIIQSVVGGRIPWFQVRCINESQKPCSSASLDPFRRDCTFVQRNSGKLTIPMLPEGLPIVLGICRSIFFFQWKVCPKWNRGGWGWECNGILVIENFGSPVSDLPVAQFRLWDPPMNWRSSVKRVSVV